MEDKGKTKKQLKEELIEAKDFLENVFKTSLDGIMVIDLAGKIMRANRTVEKILGYEKGGLSGKHTKILSPTGDKNRKMGLQRRKKFIEEGFLDNYEIEWLRKDGTICHVEHNATLLKDSNGNPIGSLTGIRDITKRKKTEMDLKETRDSLENIIKSSRDGILFVDEKGTIKSINPAVERIYGLSREELIGNHASMLTIRDENIRKNTLKRIETLFEKGFISFEAVHKKKNGKIINVESTLSMIKDEKGNYTGGVTIIRDITERKKAEKEKKELAAQLQRSEKMETIGTLAGGVAHDLNNILGAIVGYPDLLLDDIPEDSPMRSSIIAIKQSGERAAAIVQDLLTLARRGVQTTEVVHLNTIVTNLLESREYEKLMEFNPDVEVETDLEINLLNILGSPVHLSKTAMNLVSNAAEAMPGGGKITISSENRYIDKPIKGYDSIKEGDYVVFSVADAGTGIANKDLEKIFEPFYTKKVMGRSGTGLGMSVVWGTVKDHQGYIDVKSVEGQGTTFALYFPVTRKEIGSSKKPILIEEYSGNGEKILVVDDVETQRDIAANLLKKLNYNVETVTSGEEAVEYMKKQPAELLVLDMIMDPGIDGLDTYKKILGMCPEQKAIISSGFSETDRVKEAQKLGAGAYIKKPYTLEKIGLAVKQELEK